MDDGLDGAGDSASDEPRRGRFAISVVAEMVSMQIQNLRAYERRGLVQPSRTPGGTRLYSQDDVDRLHRVRELLAEGLNLAGIVKVMDLQDQLSSQRPARRAAQRTSTAERDGDHGNVK